jgi:hypothetical protein
MNYDFEHISVADLPAPRLELRWRAPNPEDEHEHICDYNLVIALGSHDIRRELEDGSTVSEQTVKLGTTVVSGGPGPVTKSGISAPFRDSAHANWDCHQLGNPPIYKVAGDIAQLA